jgi:hypothetical protein
MSTLAEITIAIDDNIRNKTPLVVKTEHADVDQLIADQLFPSSVRLTFNGTTQTSGLPNIKVPSTLGTDWKIDFDIFFEKIGNRVFYNGSISSNETAKALGGGFFGIEIATFDLPLYEPAFNRLSTSVITTAFNGQSILPNACLRISGNRILLTGVIATGAGGLIEGSYIVEN